MAAVLPAKNPSSLLQRRLSQAQYSSIEMAGLMSTFNMSFRPDADAVVSSSMPFHVAQQQLQHQQNLAANAPSMAPSELFNPAMLQAGADVAANASFSIPFNGADGFNGGSFGTLTWPPPQPIRPLTTQPAFLLRQQSHSSSDSEPFIKSEEDSPVQPCQLLYDASAYSTSSTAGSPMESSEDGPAAVFSTDIDTLMRTIQSKAQSEETSSKRESKSIESSSPNKSKKRYLCEVPGCGKAFYQKTHLEIHTRAHTGVKPFLCKEPNCGQRFSQLGNLKTHERRHTGERPYHCDICGKTFAQHGNVRAHKIVHTLAKPFTCRLDDCNKQFTQLGNLKSHQNKFHVETIRRLKALFENFQEGDVVDQWEKDMWEYFRGLYKNCNKGIKGRGKDRRISAPSVAPPRRLQEGLRRDSMVSASSTSSAMQ